MRKILLIVCGCITFGIGVLGILVPLLPTTPFLLLSASCFFKSSEPLYRWLITQKYFGRYIYCYKQYKAVSLWSKTFTILLLWGVIGSSVIIIEIVWLRLLLLVVAIGVSIHLLMLRLLTQDMIDSYEDYRKTMKNIV
ncbi:MAG: YbaN family protein [Spirochaetes bacterium]|nr:YbaN family protein [Spirochaetota bacterium]MBL7006559.1 YbaN family protein [Spirochaetia bacterium]